MKKKLIALFMAAVMLFCASCTGNASTGTLRETAAKLYEKANEYTAQIEALAIDRSPHVPFSPLSHSDIRAEDMEYFIYDSTEFLAKCDDLAACEDVFEAIDLYNWLYNEYITVESQYTVCHITYCRDISNQQAQDDQVECERVANECWDAFCAAVRDCVNGPIGEDFIIFLGKDAADAFSGYENMSVREEELAEEETRLISLYYEELEKAADTTYFYDGKLWTMDMLQGSAGSRLSYNQWYEIYNGIQREINSVLGEIFLQLVQVRDEIAEINGYDSYADYAYENIYGRDYTTEDAQTFCESVKAGVGPEFFDQVYTSSLLYSDFSYGADVEEMLRITGEYCYQLDTRLGEAWEYLTANQLYYISDSADMMQGGFTTTVSMYGAPYIHISLSGQVYDLGTVIHEFGHFCDAYWNQPKDMFLDSGSYDVFEMHSNGLEVLMLQYYPEILGEKATQAIFYSILEMLYSVIDGCIYDEFQRVVYDNPDMTLEQINQLYYDLCVAYGQYEPTDVDYYWMYVHHNFDAPMYYISYAVSSLTALQIWDLQQEDAVAARDLYVEILGYGAYEYGYMELVDMVGLTSFAEEGAAAQICARAIAYAAQLE